MDSDILYLYLKKSKRKRGEIMCAPLEKIRGKTPDEILKLINYRGDGPVELKSVLEYFNISASPLDFSEIESIPEIANRVSKFGKILGMIFSKGDHAGIFYCESSSANRQRFTIAHELAHCAMADDAIANFIDFRHTMQPDSDNEIAANTFAGKLLVSDSALKELLSEVENPPVNLLSKIFAVSENVMHERLKILENEYAWKGFT